MPDIFDEVEEDLRADRMKRLMTRYGGLFGGALLLVVVAVAGWQGWHWWEARKSDQAAEAFLAATREAATAGANGPQAAERFLAVAGDAPAGYATLARFRAAALKAEANDRDGALAIYDGIARDGAAEPLFRDLATLLWGMHALDSRDATQVRERLAPLAAATSAWRASAEEIRALAALRQGDTAEARRSLQALAGDDSAPQGIRTRAQRLLAGIAG